MAEKFDMKGALVYGIKAEIEAKEFYTKWADNVTESHYKKELQEMAEWEGEHEKSLKDYYVQLYNEEPEVDPDMIVSPELQVQTKDFNDTTSILRIAQAAYLSEMRANEFYTKLAKKADGEAKVMLEKLADMEKEHMETTRKRYMKIREDVVGFHAF
jgi:rubrerythrin